MIAVALKGLAGRKIRALLTALAVVIGVSMVSGTFILTDTMQKSFNGLFTETSAKTDAVIRGKEIVKNSTSGSGITIPAATLDKVRALPEVEAAARRRQPRRGQRRRHHRQGRQGRRQGERRRQLRRRQRPLQPVQVQDRQAAARARRGRDRRRHRQEAALQGRRHGRRLHPRQAAHVPGQRHDLVRQHRLARLREHRRLGRQDRADAAQPRGPLRRDLGRREGRHVARAARAGDQAAPARRPAGQGQRQAGQGRREGPQRRDGDDPQRAARLRRHRAARRRVRDLQHPVDHGRPAHARVRDAADARRLAQAGHALGASSRAW